MCLLSLQESFRGKKCIYVVSNRLLNIQNSHFFFIFTFIELNKNWVWYMCAQLCLILCDPMDCSPRGSSVHGIFQERIVEWVAISCSAYLLTIWATREAHYPYVKVIPMAWSPFIKIAFVSTHLSLYTLIYILCIYTPRKTAAISTNFHTLFWGKFFFKGKDFIFLNIL